MPKDTRKNIKISQETHTELSRFVRHLSVKLDKRVTYDEAILYALNRRRD